MNGIHRGKYATQNYLSIIIIMDSDILNANFWRWKYDFSKMSFDVP